MWYALVQDEQLGPMPAEEMIGLHTQDIVAADTFIWREGMADWLPFADVEEFAHLFDEASEEATMAVAPGAFFAQLAPAADLDESEDGATMMLGADGGQEWADVVAAVEAVEAPSGPPEDPPLPPGFGVAPVAMRGAPNTGPGGRASMSMPGPPTPQPRKPLPPRPPAPRPELSAEPTPMLDDDDIELIDLDDLESVGALEDEPPAPVDDFVDPFAAAPEPAPGGFVDPFAGAEGAGEFAPNREAPVPADAPIPLTSPSRSGGKGLWIGLVVLLLGGGAAAFFLTQKPPPTPPPKTSQAALEPVRIAPPDAATPPPAPDAARPPPDAAPVATDGGSKDAAAPDAAAPDAAAPDAAPPEPDAAPPKPDARRVAAAKPRAPRPRARTPRPKPPTPPPAASNLPRTLSRADMMSVLKANQAKLSACAADAPDARGTISVQVVIQRSGKVSRAKVATAKLRGTPAAVCVEKTVRDYGFKPFSGDPMRLNLPLRL
jgi:hypothetical protein